MRNKLHDLIFDGMVKYVEAGELSVHVDAEAFADYLIANGVTIADDNNVGKWIPVSERLPEKTCDVLLYFEENTATGFWQGKDTTNVNWCSYTDSGWYTDCESEPTHWMPLPTPPKEGE